MDASQTPAPQAGEASPSSPQVTQKTEQALGSSSTWVADLVIPGSGLESNQISGDEQPNSEESPRNVHGFAWTLVVVATISTMFLFGLDQTITADVQPAIIKQFNEVDKLPWVSVTLLLGASASNLFWYVRPTSSTIHEELALR